MPKKYTDAFDDKEDETLCDFEGCQEKGEYPAPKSRQALRDYLWFCLEHVRHYNKSWNYYKGMSQGQIEASQASDFMWERDAYPFGRGVKSETPFATFQFYDPLNLGQTSKKKSPAFSGQYYGPFLPTSDEAKAMKLMEVSYPINQKALKENYKRLAKKYHPDVLSKEKKRKNQDDMIKQINLAYDLLKKI